MKKEKYVDNMKETSLIISASKIDSVKIKDITKKSVRIYDGGYIGIAGGIGEVSTEELEKKAKENIKNKIPYEYEISKDKCISIDKTSEGMNDKELLSEGEELLSRLCKENEDFIFSHKITMMERSTSLSNDENLNLSYKDKSICTELIFKEKSSSSIFDGFIGYEGRKYNREQYLNMASRILKAYKNEVSLPLEGKYKVGVYMDSCEELFLQIFSKDLNGRTFKKGGSIFSEKTGKKLFNENFTLMQTKNPKDVCLQPYFDMEGTVTEDYSYNLIENGVLLSPYTDKKTSKLYNLKNTAAASGNYDEVPTLGVPTLKVKPSNKTLKELFNGEEGILVYIASGGDYTSSGKFGTPVQLAFLFDGEHIIGRLPELQISSDVYKMFNEDFLGVCSDSLFGLEGGKVMVMNMDVKNMK
ncbi:metallopeptidase TldD-related protein [Haloimpatiens sp. FM7330]|uniref:metallopeptidase TldD-related protein n=1 Tax=Haloimpatiens sp. FM7330 TaxID=3298610 RepID=UPI003630D814